MFDRKDLKAAFDLWCFITILGIAMMLSFRAGQDHKKSHCDECGYELMLDDKTDKEIADND